MLNIKWPVPGCNRRVDRLSEPDIESIIAEERRFDADGLSALGKELTRHPPAFLEIFGAGGIECPAKTPGVAMRGHQLGVRRVVKLPDHHFLSFTSHRSPSARGSTDEDIELDRAGSYDR